MASAPSDNYGEENPQLAVDAQPGRQLDHQPQPVECKIRNLAPARAASAIPPETEPPIRNLRQRVKNCQAAPEVAVPAVFGYNAK